MHFQIIEKQKITGLVQPEAKAVKVNFFPMSYMYGKSGLNTFFPSKKVIHYNEYVI